MIAFLLFLFSLVSIAAWAEWKMSLPREKQNRPEWMDSTVAYLAKEHSWEAPVRVLVSNEITAQDIDDWEAGRAIPSPEQAQAVEALTGIPASAWGKDND